MIRRKNRNLHFHGPVRTAPTFDVAGLPPLLSLVSLVLLLTPGCLKGPNFMQTRGAAEGLDNSFIVETTEDAGDVSGIIQSAMNRAQTLNAAAGSAVDGAAVVFPPGALAIDAPVIVGEGSDAASADILAQVGLDTTVATGVGSSLYVSTSATTDPVLPMTLSLPLPSSSGLAGLVSSTSKALFLDTDTTKYAVAFVAEKKATGETFVGFIPNKELTFKDGKAQFETSNWGSYRLIQLAPEAEKPVERVVRNTAADVAPRRQNEVKDRPKMNVTGRAPFVTQAGGTVIITGENLVGVRAFIKDRKLVTTESTDGLTLTVTIPATADLTATTGNGSGMFFIGLGQDGSPGGSTNIFIPRNTTAITEAVLSPDPNRICARQEFLDGAGMTRTGSGLGACTGRPSNVTACAESNLANCVTSASWPAVEVARVRAESLKSGTVLTLASGPVTGAFPSSSAKLIVPTNASAADISAHPDFAQIPAYGASGTDTKTMTLLTDAGEGVTFNLRRAGEQTSTAASDAPPVLTPGSQPIDRSATNTLYTGFGVAGTGLSANMIVAGKTIFGVSGTTLPRNYWSKSGSTWTDGATGYNWDLVDIIGTNAPATCKTGSLPTPQDLFWAWSTGMTSGPGAMLTGFTIGTTTTSIKLWTQTTTNGTATNKIFVFTNAASTSDPRLPTTSEETAWTACVEKPTDSAGNGP
jgi:hypothetical protein